MSVGYAEKLSYRDDLGAVGQRELSDSEDDVQRKSIEVAELVCSLFLESELWHFVRALCPHASAESWVSKLAHVPAA